MYDLNHTWKRICQGFAKLQSAHCTIVKSTIATFAAFPPCPLHIAILPNCQVLVHPVHFLQWASSCPHIKKICGLFIAQFVFPPPVCQNFCTKKSDCPWIFFPTHGLPSEFTCGVYLWIAKLDWCVLNPPSTSPLLFLKEYVKGHMAHYWSPLCPWMSLIKGMSFRATVISWMNFSPCKFNFSIMEFYQSNFIHYSLENSQMIFYRCSSMEFGSLLLHKIRLWMNYISWMKWNYCSYFCG
jgi:hypothetical protein